jgi:putative hemolysin
VSLASRLLVWGSLVMGLASCAQHGAPASPPALELANPASTRCVGLGGELSIETMGNGDAYGVCVFEDNRQCEEWALFRGDCPEGGREVTGLGTRGARLCVILGGRYTVTAEATRAAAEQGACALPSGAHCEAGELEAGRCPR